MIELEPRPTAADLHFTLFRIPVRIHPFFWLAAVLLTFPTNQTAMQENLFLFMLVSVACVLVSIVVHEFGHALCQRHYRDRANHVVLYHFGGLAVGSREPPRVGQRVLISLCGPGAGFVLSGLAFACQVLIRQGVLPAPNVYLDDALYFLLWTNVIWGALNLVPVFPLDGGQVMRELVLWKWPARGEVFVFTISFYVALAATAASVAWFLFGFARGATGSLLPAVIFGVLAYSSYDLRRRIAEYGGGLDEREPRQPWEQDADWWKRK